jgi:hypothetical protein
MMLRVLGEKSKPLAVYLFGKHRLSQSFQPVVTSNYFLSVSQLVSRHRHLHVDELTLAQNKGAGTAFLRIKHSETHSLEDWKPSCF